MEKAGAHPFAGFEYHMVRYVQPEDVWLTLDDTAEESRPPQLEPARWEWLTLPECESFHKQLFYWLALRFGTLFQHASSPECLPRSIPNHN